MYSNTQEAFSVSPTCVRSERMPSLSTTTISPGSRSRTRCAPMASRAQLSEAKMVLLPNCPMHRGRKPCGSRAAINLLGDMMTSEYAPFKWFIARQTASSMEFEAMRSRVMA